MTRSGRRASVAAMSALSDLARSRTRARAKPRIAALLLLGALLPAACTCTKSPPAPTPTPVPVVEAPTLPLPPALANDPNSPLRSLPADAALIAHVDVRALLASPLWRENEGLMREDPEAARTLEALRACAIDLPTIASIDLAVDRDGRAVALSLRGDGVGDPERLRCVGERLFAGDPKRWAVASDGAATTVTLDGGAAIGHAIAADHLVVASEAWDPALRRRLAGEDPLPGGGPLSEALAAVRVDAPIWFAGRLPTMLGPSDHLRSITGAIDLERGLALELALGMSRADQVAELEEDLTRRASNIRARLVRAGLPGAAADRLQIDAIGTTLKVRAALEIAEIQAIRALLAAEATAPPGGPAPGANAPAQGEAATPAPPAPSAP